MKVDEKVEREVLLNNVQLATVVGEPAPPVQQEIRHRRITELGARKK